MDGGTVLEKLQVIISASTKPLIDGLKKVNQTVKNTSDNIEKNNKRIGDTFKKVGKVVGTALSVAAVVRFSKSCIALGSDLSEVQNVVDTTFGSASDDINKFSKNAITQFGLSELSAKKYSSTMGAMLKSMGLTNDQVLDMSKSITGLSGDIASFYNLSGDEAFAKIRSGISGETEPLKQLGINLSVANLEAYALSQGMTKSYNSMTQAEQAILRYNYLLSVTKDAQGDFAKTSDSWANQTKILQERFNSLKASIGQGLINVFTPVLRVINLFINRLAVAAESFQIFTEKIFGASGSSSSGGLASELSKASESSFGISDAMEDASKSAKSTSKSLAGFDKLNNISSASNKSESSGGVSAGAINSIDTVEKSTEGMLNRSNAKIRALTGFINNNFGDAFRKIYSSFKSNIQNIQKTFKNVWKDIKKLGSPLASWFSKDYIPFLNEMIVYIGACLNNMLAIFNTVFSSLWNQLIYPVLFNFIAVGLPVITQFATNSMSALTEWSNEITQIFIMLWQEGVGPTLELLTSIWTDCINILADVWNQYGTPIFKQIEEAIHNVAKTFKKIWAEWIKPVFDKFISVLQELWDKHLNPFITKLATFAAAFVECALIIYNKFISPIVNFLVDVLSPVIDSTFSWIFEFVGAIIGNLIDCVGGILTALKGVIDFIKGVFTGDWELAWKGIKEIFSGIWDSFVEIAKVPLNLVIGLINKFIAAAEGAINAVIKGLNKISIDVPDWVPGLGGEKFGFNLKQADFGQIPYLAKGGIVSKATLSVIGEAGKEAVLPLENNTGWMDKFADYVALKLDFGGVISAIERLSKSIGNGDIYLTAELDGDVVYKTVVKKNNQHVKQTGISEFVY